MLDFRLRSLLEVVRTGGFSTAAEVLHLTQPAVSQHIRALEELYGVTLLLRKGKRTRPTPEGELLFVHAERMEALSRSMDRDMATARSVVRTFEVGATLTIAEYLLPRLIGRYRRENEHVRIRLSVENTDGTIHRLQRNELVLAIVEGPFREEGLLSSKLAGDELLAVCAPGHPIVAEGEPARRTARRAVGRRVGLATLLGSDLILREPGSGTREVFERYLVLQGVDPRSVHPYMEIGSINAIKSLVKSELGVTILSRLSVEAELEEGSLVRIPIDGPPIHRELRFVWNEYSDRTFVEEFSRFCVRSIG